MRVRAGNWNGERDLRERTGGLDSVSPTAPLPNFAWLQQVGGIAGEGWPVLVGVCSLQDPFGDVSARPAQEFLSGPARQHGSGLCRSVNQQDAYCGAGE